MVMRRLYSGGKQVGAVVLLILCLSATGCQRLGLPDSGSSPSGSTPQPPSKAPEPPPAPPPEPAAPEVAPPAPVAPPPKVVTTRNHRRPLTTTDELVGLTPSALATRLGQPNLKRFEKPDQLWQYRAGVCLLELRMRPDGNQTKVAEAVMRPEPGQTVSDRDCLAAVNDALHLTGG